MSFGYFIGGLDQIGVFGISRNMKFASTKSLNAFSETDSTSSKPRRVVRPRFQLAIRESEKFSVVIVERKYLFSKRFSEIVSDAFLCFLEMLTSNSHHQTHSKHKVENGRGGVRVEGGEQTPSRFISYTYNTRGV